MPADSIPHEEAEQSRSPTGAEDFNEVWRKQPAAPARDRAIEVYVVGRRCVYVNDYRIAGSKPYFTENLPSHELKTTLGEVLDAFKPAEIRKALAEKKARQDYFAAYHARQAASADTRPQDEDALAASLASGAVGAAETPKSEQVQ